MSNPRKRPLWRLILKVFAAGSVAAAPTAAGQIDPPEAIRHEQVWAAVRDKLSEEHVQEPIPEHLRRLIEQAFNKEIGARVDYTYRSISPDAIGALDKFWMEHLSSNGATATQTDQFLSARAEALAERVKDQPEKFEGPEDWQNIIREYRRTPYPGGFG